MALFCMALEQKLQKGRGRSVREFHQERRPGKKLSGLKDVREEQKLEREDEIGFQSSFFNFCTACIHTFLLLQSHSVAS